MQAKGNNLLTTYLQLGYKKTKNSLSYIYNILDKTTLMHII